MELDNKLLGTLRQRLQHYQAKKVLVAVSGGVDSMVLLHVVSRVLKSDDFAVVDVDHNLRPESASEVSFVKNYCAENGYRFFTTKWRQKA
jgi:Predicted ATPase of the PP-loop superfamily implicated in cell cycle control